MGESLWVDLSSDLLDYGCRVRFRASGYSMQPAIQDGECITIEAVKVCDVKVGDVVLYRTSRGAIAHRVVRILTGTKLRGLPSGQGAQSPEGAEDLPVFIVRGDAAAGCDEPVRAVQILGRVICTERSGRSIRLDSRTARMIYTGRRGFFVLKRRVAGRFLKAES